MRRTSPFADPAWARASDNLAKIIAGNPEGKAAYQAALTDIKSTQQADRITRENRGHFNTAADALQSGDLESAYVANMRAADADVMGELPSFIQGFGGASMAAGNINADQQRALISGNDAGALDAETALTFDEGRRIQQDDAAAALTEALQVQQLENRGAVDKVNAEAAHTLEGLLAGQVRSGGMDIGDAYRIDDPFSTDEYTASQAQAEGLTADETERLGDNMSLDEVLAQQYNMNQLSLEDVGKYRYGHGWANDLDAGGSGSGGDSGLDTLDLQRLEEMEGSFENQAMLMLQDMGGPTVETKDGPVLDTSAAPDLLPAIIDSARQAYITDWQSGRVPAPVASYVQSAIQSLGVNIDDGVRNWALDDDPSISWSGQGSQQQGGGPSLPVVTSDADYESLPPGTRFQDENGETFTKPGA